MTFPRKMAPTKEQKSLRRYAVWQYHRESLAKKRDRKNPKKDPDARRDRQVKIQMFPDGVHRMVRVNADGSKPRRLMFFRRSKYTPA